MKRGWKGAIVGGVVGFAYALIGIYYSFASGFVGYGCPFKINSFVDVIFYPIFLLGCLPFFENAGIVGFFIYFLFFIFIGVVLGRCFKRRP